MRPRDCFTRAAEIISKITADVWQETRGFVRGCHKPSCCTVWLFDWHEMWMMIEKVNEWNECWELDVDICDLFSMITMCEFILLLQINNAILMLLVTEFLFLKEVSFLTVSRWLVWGRWIWSSAICISVWWLWPFCFLAYNLISYKLMHDI